MNKKSNYTYVGISFILLVFGIIFIPKIIDRVSNDDIIRDESRSNKVTNTSTKDKSDLAYLLINNKPKKVPTFSFTNQNGETITNEDYLGKVYVVEFFFTTCPTICPIMNRNLVEIQNKFKDFKNFGVASFSITPEIDTPKVLKDYAENYGITNPNWHLMTGNEDAIYSLANEGFNLYTAKDDSVEGGFEHSGNFALIDKEGYIRSRKDNFGNPLIFYNGIITEAVGVDEDGISQEITILKEDIAKLFTRVIMEPVNLDKEKKYNKWIVALSIIIPVAVAILFGVNLRDLGFEVEPLTFLPPIYATINGLTALVLIIAVIAIKNNNRKIHEQLMKFAIMLSVAFLLMYIAYHMTSDSTKYGGEGAIRYLYFFILISHILLSIVIIPFVLITYVRAITNNIERHKKIAKITFPLWLYVAITGVIVYIMISPYYA